MLGGDEGAAAVADGAGQLHHPGDVRAGATAVHDAVRLTDQRHAGRES